MFFKTCKSMLHLSSECHCLSYDALTAHVSLVFIRYMFLSLQQRRNSDDRTISELFLLVVDELANIAFADALQIIVDIMLRSLTGSPAVQLLLRWLLWCCGLFHNLLILMLLQPETFKISGSNIAPSSVEYSLDKGATWTPLSSANQAILLANVGDMVMFRGNNASYNGEAQFVIASAASEARGGTRQLTMSDKLANAIGNIYSLVFGKSISGSIKLS